MWDQEKKKFKTGDTTAYLDIEGKVEMFTGSICRHAGESHSHEYQPLPPLTEV